MKAHLLIEPSTPIGPLARFFPEAMAVFEAFDIDYACFGGRSIAGAAAAAGADLARLLGELETAAHPAAALAEPPLGEIVHRIIVDHHRTDRDTMRDLMHRSNPRGKAPEELRRIHRLLVSLGSELGPHARREEKQLFPQIEELAARPHHARSGRLSQRLFAEFIEHAVIHDRLQKIRELALRLRGMAFDDITLLDDLETFDRTAHRHVHLENNVLIPRVVEIENTLRAETLSVTLPA
jgi:regulator of cell morphogenesis and NO signaling